MIHHLQRWNNININSGPVHALQSPRAFAVLNWEFYFQISKPQFRFETQEEASAFPSIPFHWPEMPPELPLDRLGKRVHNHHYMLSFPNKADSSSLVGLEDPSSHLPSSQFNLGLGN